jgi:nucleolar protein 4
MKKLGKHGGRLILRNIPFSIQEKALRAWLEKVGPLKELTIPVTSDNKRNRGFAFVEFDKKNLSEKAIKKLNGKLLQNRQVSLDYAQSKEKYETSVKAEEMAKDFKPVIQEEEVQEEVQEEDERKDEKEKQQKNLFLEGRVLFAMNINYMTEDEDLFERFKEFGRLNYAKIVRNKETGESKGTAFICFKKPEVVEKVLQISEESGIELDERKLKLVKAVSREAATNLKTSKPLKDDKRNLHLTKLALISPDSKEFQTLSEKEVQMRTMAAKKMKEKLQNPNIFVSPTRLLFRNISKSITEDDLKVLVKKILIEHDSSLANQKLFVQVKVLKETEKLDKQGNPLSKGFAFIEFKKPEFALKAIKLCNNDSKYFGGKFRPIVEFSLEDHRVLRIRKLKLARQKKKNLEKIGEKEKKEKIGRGKKQRMKRKLKKEGELKEV